MPKKALYVIPVLIAGFFLFLNSSLADNSLQVVINEVAWMGNVDLPNKEWLELYNNSATAIDLTGWKLTAQDGTPSLVLKGIIEAHGYFLLERTDDTSVSGITADQIYVGPLGNNGEYLQLYDNDNNLVDGINCQSGWYFGGNDNKNTMERINPLVGDNIINWSNSSLPAGTPRAENSVYVIPNINPIADAGGNKNGKVGEEIFFNADNSVDIDGSVINFNWDFGDGQIGSGKNISHIYDFAGWYDVFLLIADNNNATSSDNILVEINDIATTIINISPNDIVINEFVADPVSGQKEWIELYNNSTSTINLSSFVLEDGLGQISSLSGEIISHSFKIFELASSKLNNGGDQIILKYQDKIIDQITYGDWDDGNALDNILLAHSPNSVARLVDGQGSVNHQSDFSVTTTPTKNASNLINQPVSIIEKSPSNNNSSSGNPVLLNMVFQKSDIVINELVSDPSDGEVEWIELYNNSLQTIDFHNWLIEDGSGGKTILQGSINSHQFKVIENPKGSLNNSGDLIILKDPSNIIIDQMAYGAFNDNNIFDNALVSNDPNSVARLIDGVDSDIDYNDFRITSTPTKGLANIINGLASTSLVEKVVSQVEILDYPSLQIMEILVNPLGSDMNDEFIEIYNPNGVGVDLNNWLIDDATSGSRPYKIIDLIIEPHEYLAFFRKDTNLALNNNNDQVRLINPLSKISSEIEYKNIKEGLAYAMDKNQIWQLTATPTPGEENEIINSPKTIKNSSVANKLVKIKGTVLVEPGILGSQFFYITNENIQVYSFAKEFPELVTGDVIDVVGEISDTISGRRIKIKNKNDIKVVSKVAELLPIEISTSEINESYEGNLVKIVGEVIEIKGNYIYLDDGSEEAKIYLKSSTKIDKSLFKEGQNIGVIGIVSKTNSGFVILPRYETDFIIFSEVKGEKDQSNITPNGNQKYYLAIGIFISVLSLWFGYRYIKLNTKI